jgi:hypothetical protein
MVTDTIGYEHPDQTKHHLIKVKLTLKADPGHPLHQMEEQTLTPTTG